MRFLNMLCEAAADKPQNTTASIILLIVMGVLIVGYFFYSSYRRKKDYAQAQQAIDELKVGDKIVTTSGMFGTIKGINETTFGKVFLIESGEGKNVSYFNIGANAIWGLDTKEDVVLDEDGKPLQTPEDMKKAKEKLLKTTDKKEEPAKEEKKEKTEKVEKEEKDKEEVKEEPKEAETEKTEKPKRTRKTTKKDNK